MMAGLDDKNRWALIKYRLERAHETIKEAELLLTGNYYNAAINRLYYACFYAAEALLLSKGISTRTHAGVRSMLGLHFVSKGLMSIDSGKTFSVLFELRHDGDYDDFAYSDRETVEEYIPKANAFINEVETLLKDKD